MTPLVISLQISAYAESAGDKEAAFLAIDKSSGEIVLIPIEDIHMINASDRVEPSQRGCYI